MLGLTYGVKNVDNLNNVKHETSRNFRNKKTEYLKAKNEFETNSKMKKIRDLYRVISDFEKGYQPRTNIVKDKKGDLVTDSHSILARWRNHFSQLFNIHGVSTVRQTKIHAAEPLVAALSVFVVEMPIEKLKGHKSPGIGQIPAELIKAGGRTIRFKVLKLVTSVWNKEELPEEWKESSIVPVCKKGIKQIVVIMEAYHLCQLCTKFYPSSCCQG